MTTADAGLAPYATFEEASRRVLDVLHARLGFGLWMVTRATDDDDWIILDALDHHYGVEAGTVLMWSDSFCSRMIDGFGPRIAPRAADIAAYARAPIAGKLEIGAYIGIPIADRDGGVFGTICAIDPVAQPATIVEEQELLEVMGSLLSTILSGVLREDEIDRSRQLAELAAATDPVTSLANRGGFDAFLEAEDERCAHVGGSAAVLAIDVSSLAEANARGGRAAGDELLRRAGAAIRTTIGGDTLAARVGGGAFALVAPGLTRRKTEDLVEQLRRALAEHAVEATVAARTRTPSRSLAAGWASLEDAIYATRSDVRPAAAA